MFRTVVSLILWPIWFLYLIAILPIFLLFTLISDRKYFHYFLRPMCYFFCLLGGQLVKRTGSIPDAKNGPYLYLINHQSLFDHFVIGCYINHYVTAIAKQEHFSYPLWGQVAKSYGIVPINRKNIKKALSSLKVAEDAILKDKVSILMFPEGTRSIDGNLGVFKKGAFHIAKNT
ncbi:MAG: lysophospholipid acyltransferase family protein, partial [Candidatus Marinimicrobia bacterium]|nr:lysophospholipid acyltransferase family protein [Candidatus Neomarinimicrobiota bacterium]